MSTQLAPVDDPNAIDPFSNDLWARVGPVEWTDYAGDAPLADGEVDQSGGSGPFACTQTRRYFGLGGDQTTDAQGAATATNYWHEDLIGSRAMVSDDAGELAGRIAYSAFGELLDASGLPGGSPPAGSPRYQYAAAHGYESDLLTLQGPNTDLPPITLQHLGHRWYQPDIGRFIQRDPIGIAGGLNVYAYCHGNPCNSLDPDGTDIISVPGKYYSHEGVAVQDPVQRNQWHCYDYMPKTLGQAWDQGKINYAFNWEPPPGRRMATSPKEDAAALAELNRWRANPPYYCIPFRCCYSMNAAAVCAARPY